MQSISPGGGSSSSPDPASGAPQSPEQPSTEPPVQTLGRASIAWRLAALLLGTVLVVRGSVIGNDIDWPFAPMSQFAFRIGPNDAVRATFLQGRTADGEIKLIPISVPELGLARAEIEGQQPRIIRDPSMLADLAASYARLHPGQPRLTQLWLNERVDVLRNGRGAGERVDTLVGWPDNDTAPKLPR